MPIPHLTDEQIRTWTREEKDRWWLTNVFRGDMPQLTIRSAITGFLLGGILSATNLYIGAKTGWTLGVGLTSVILAFAAFKVLSAIRLGRDFTILENNAMQSIATSAGYMTGPLISGLAAYMMVKNELIPMSQLIWFSVVLSVLGVLVAFPMKRRFINEEQAPFPEGAACGVVLDTLYTSEAAVGLFKAKALVVAGLMAGALKFISGEAYQVYAQVHLLGRSSALYMSEHLDAWYYKLAEKNHWLIPNIFGVDIRKLGLSPTLDLAMFGAGGLMNIRYAVNMLVGMVFAWCYLGPYAVSQGWVQKKGAALAPAATFSRTDVLNAWVLWPGVAILVCASLTAFFAKPQVIISAFTKVLGRRNGQAEADVLGHIELPLWVSWVGIPIVGAVGVWMAHEWFGVAWVYGAMAIPLVILLTLIAANATALTSITPTGSLSKITQFTFGVMDPKHPQTNLMTAVMTTEVASNASNLLMDIKPGYMLGAKPRQQAIGHCIGILAGALAATPLFFVLFLAGHPDNPFTPADPALANATIEQTLIRIPEGGGDPKFSFIAAVQWKGIADFMTGLTGDAGLTAIIHGSALVAMAIAAVLGVGLEIVRLWTRNKLPISPVALGLGMVLPPDSTIWMFLGCFFFWAMGAAFGRRERSLGRTLWVETREPICAGLIAGAALVGIGDILVKVFLLRPGE
jgi:OPT family oligopeptide transporter